MKKPKTESWYLLISTLATILLLITNFFSYKSDNCQIQKNVEIIAELHFSMAAATVMGSALAIEGIGVKQPEFSKFAATIAHDTQQKLLSALSLNTCGIWGRRISILLSVTFFLNLLAILFAYKLIQKSR